MICVSSKFCLSRPPPSYKHPYAKIENHDSLVPDSTLSPQTNVLFWFMNSTNFKKTTNTQHNHPDKNKSSKPENHQNNKNKASWRIPSKPVWQKHRREREEEKLRKSQAQKRKSWNYSKFNYLRRRREIRTNNLRINEIG